MPWYNKAKQAITREVKPNQINSLLMSTVAGSYFYPGSVYRGEYTTIDNLQRNQFILTDDCQNFIPVFSVMRRTALESKDTGRITFKTSISFKTEPNTVSLTTRNLTSSEQARLLSHSSDVKKYYQAIESSIA